MAIRVECEECGKKYKLSDDRAGEWIECRECGFDIEVPDDGWDDAWDDEPRGRGRGRSRYEDEDEGLSPGAKWAIIGGSCGFILILVLVVMLSGGGDDPPQPAGNNDDRLANNDRPNARPRVNPGTQPGQPTQPRVNTNTQPRIQPTPTTPGGMQPAPETAKPGPPPAVNATNWRVAVNPAPQPVVDPEAEPVAEVDDSKPISITFPKDSRGSNALVMPVRPTGLVVLGENASEARMREFWNARTGKRVGLMTGLNFSPHRQAVSPTGAFYAATTFSTPGVLVWDVLKKEALGELPLTADGKRPSETYLAIPSDDRIVAVIQENRSGKYVTTVNLWELPSGDPLKSFEIDGRFEDDLCAFSPGGRFLSLRSSDSQAPVTFYDLASGTNVGQIRGPDYSKSSKRAAEAKAVAFSADGSQLAMLFRGSEQQVVVYDVATGQARQQITVESKLTYGGPRDSRPIQWFPDGKKLLLFGNSIASIESESIIHTFPKPKQDQGGGVWITGDNQLGGIAGDYQNPNFTLVKVTDEAIADQKDRIARGETADDAGLPPLSKSSGDKAKAIAREQTVSGWTLAPDPSPGLGNSYLKQPIQIPISADIRVSSGRFLVASNAPRAALHCGADRRPDSNNAPSIEILDLASGQRTGSIPLNFAAATLAISPDGKRVITRGQARPSRLDVWDLETKEHLVGWKPKLTEWSVPQSGDPRDPLSGFRGVDSPLSAEFVDADHVLTVFSEATILWKVPELTAVYIMPRVRAAVLTPGRKYLLRAGDGAQRGLVAHDSLTGEALGQLPVKGVVSEISVSASGEHLALKAYQKLIALDWKTGAVQTQFTVPHVSGRLSWSDDRFLVSTDGRVVDTQEQLIVWRYLTMEGTVAASAPDSRSWLAMSNGRNSGTATISALQLPDPQVRSGLAQMDLKGKMLMEPGSAVSVQVTAAASPPGQSNYQATVTKKISDSLTKAGHKVQQGAPFRVVVSVSRRLTGEKMPFTSETLGRFGIPNRTGSTKVEVPVEEVSVSVKLLAGAKELWGGPQTKFSNQVGMFSRFTLKEGETLQQVLSKSMWNSVDSTLSSIGFPQRIFDPSMSNGFGTSLFVNGQPTLRPR